VPEPHLTAEQRLRGILARDLTRVQIDDLVSDLYAEFRRGTTASGESRQPTLGFSNQSPEALNVDSQQF
jgi:hypothetical protein